jgi:hypothetical protein
VRISAQQRTAIMPLSYIPYRGLRRLSALKFFVTKLFHCYRCRDIFFFKLRPIFLHWILNMHSVSYTSFSWWYTKYSLLLILSCSLMGNERHIIYFYNGGKHPVARIIKSQDKPSSAASIVRALFRAIYVHDMFRLFPKAIFRWLLYNTKYLKRSYHIIAKDPLSQY